MTSLIPFLFAFVIGYLISMKLISLNNPINQLLLRIFIGIGIGIGVLSVLNFIAFNFPFSQNNYFVSKLFNKILLIMLALSCLVVLFYDIKLNPIQIKFKSISFSKILFSLFVLCGLIFIFDRFWAISAENSHGGWDAWSIWNLHARFIFLAGSDWKRLFSPEMVWSHTDYPLMTPAMIVFGWKILANESKLIPMILGGVFLFSTLGLVFSTLKTVRNEQIAILGLLFLGFSLPFIEEASLQYADVPLAYYFAAIFSLTLISMKNKQKSNTLFFVIGSLVGFASWTKNEGQLFGLIYIVCFIFLVFIIEKQLWKKLGAIILGILPMTIILIIFKSLTLGNDLISTLGSKNNLLNITSVERYSVVLRTAFRILMDFGQANVNLFVLLAVLLLFVGIQRQAVNRGTMFALVVLFFTFCSYLFVYVLTPKDITWHMNTSFFRLMIQLYPSLIIVVFSILRNPFEKRIASQAESI